MMLSEDQKKNGVIAASAGNHALALAYHGGKLSKFFSWKWFFRKNDFFRENDFFVKFCNDSIKYNLAIVNNLFLLPKLRYTCNGGYASGSPNYESRKL